MYNQYLDSDDKHQMDRDSSKKRTGQHGCNSNPVATVMYLLTLNLYIELDALYMDLDAVNIDLDTSQRSADAYTVNSFT